MEELNGAWVRMTKLLHALQAQADEMETKMADVRALVAASPPSAGVSGETLRFNSQQLSSTVLPIVEHEAPTRSRSLSGNLSGYNILPSVKPRDDDIRVTAAVSIAHKDGLSYDEHDLVVPFNCTIDRVKRLIFQVVPQLHENRLDEFELSIDGIDCDRLQEELMVEFNRFSELASVRQAIITKEPVMVEVQAKESKKKRNTKKKDKKNKGSKLQPATIKVVSRTTPILERKMVGLKSSSGETGAMAESKPAGLMSPKLGETLQADQSGSPARGRRDSDPRAFAASSRELLRLTDDDHRNKLNKLTPTQSGRNNRHGDTLAPAEKEKARGGSVIVGREKRTKSDASSDGEQPSPISSPLLSPHDRPRSSGHQDKPAAASKLRESNAARVSTDASPRGKTSSEERGRSGTDSTALAVPSGSRSKEGSSSGHKRSQSSGSRESEPVVDLELDALKELMGGDLSLDLKLGALDHQDDVTTTTATNTKRKNSAGSGKCEETPADRHRKKLSKSRSKSSRNNVMDSSARSTASDRKSYAGETKDERESLKLLLASLDTGSLSIVVDTPPPPLRVPSPLTTTPTKTRPKSSGGTDKRRSKERGSAAMGTVERAADSIALINVSSGGGSNNEKQRALDDRVKVLEEREKKLIEWEEQLFKEEMERDAKNSADRALGDREADLARKEADVDKKVKAAEEALAERERAMAQREIELEQRIGKKLEDQMHQTLEARTRSLVDWEERLRTQESSFRSREVDRLGIQSLERYDELMKIKPDHAIRMQSYVRRAMAKLRVQRALGDGPGKDAVLKQLKSRAGTLNEIVKSEAAYVQYLTVLMEAFALPIRQKGVLRLEDQLCLFANIGNVLSLHRRFLGDLRQRYTNWPSQQLLGDLFCKYMKLFHEEYAVYVLSYHASIELLHALKAATSKSPFVAFLEKTQAERAKQLRGLDLSSFLIMPVQRIPRYEILIAVGMTLSAQRENEVLSNTPEGHADLSNLRAGLEKIRGLNEALNDKQQEADLLRRVQELERKKSERATPLRRSKSMRGLLNSFSKRRGSLTVTDADHSKQLSGNAIQRQSKSRAEPGSLLKVFVHQGKNLMPVDNDESRKFPDPYCMITLSGQMLRTSVAEKTADPQWDQDFTYNVTSVSDSLCITCYDWNQSARGQPLGFIELPFSTIAEIAQGTAQWFRLHPIRKQGYAALSFSSSASSTPSSSPSAARLAASSSPTASRLATQSTPQRGRISAPPALQLSSLPVPGESPTSPNGTRPSPRPRRLTPYSVVPSNEMSALGTDGGEEWMAEMEVQLSFVLNKIDTAHTDVQSRQRCDSGLLSSS